jgi:hypothetical protein
MHDEGEHDSEVIQRDDGISMLVDRVRRNYATAVPKDLFRSPPSWVLKLVEGGATYQELAQEVGEVARYASRPDEWGELLQVVEQIAVTDEGRRAIDRVLAPEFVPQLVTASATVRASLAPSMIVYENADTTSGHRAWISPYEDERVDPVGKLQQLHLDQAISAVWQNHRRPFLELFLFEGTDLQGRQLRIARVQTSVNELPVVLGSGASLNDRTRSLLGSVRNVPGRRFSAKQQLLSLVTSILSQHAQAPFGTITLIQPVQFSWDGYAAWQASPNTLPKTAALRVRVDFRLDDVSHGQFVGFQNWDVVLRRDGGATPVEWVLGSASPGVPQPWAGSVDLSNPRWQRYISRQRRRVHEAFAQAIGQLAGATPGAVRILPGRSGEVPSPPSTHWGLIETGRTDDDATIVLSP